jgi:hypothetical protein
MPMATAPAPSGSETYAAARCRAGEDCRHLQRARAERANDCDGAPPLLCREREHLREHVDADDAVEDGDRAQERDDDADEPAVARRPALHGLARDPA